MHWIYMARRSDHTRDELKQMAIDAGIRLIEAKGYGAFSARAVAADMGYTVGTLYNVFGTIDGLILHINAATLDLWYGTLTRTLAGKPKHPIRALGRAYIQFARTHHARWSALFEHRIEGNGALPEWYTERMLRFFTLVEDQLPPYLGKDKKRIKRTARLLWAGIHGICVLGLTNKLALVGSDSIETLADALISSLLEPPTPL